MHMVQLSGPQVADSCSVVTTIKLLLLYRHMRVVIKM